MSFIEGWFGLEPLTGWQATASPVILVMAIAGTFWMIWIPRREQRKAKRKEGEERDQMAS